MTPFLIATLLALLITGGLLLVFREHRKYFPYALAGVIITAALIITYVTQVAPHRTTDIPATQVTLENTTVSVIAGSWRVRAQLNNQSTDVAISSIPLRLIVEDCINTSDAGKPSCTPIAEATLDVIISVPPQQTRTIQAAFPITTHIQQQGKTTYQVTVGTPNTWRTHGG